MTRSVREVREKLQGRPENRFRGDWSLFMACLGDGDKEEGFGRWNLLGFFFARATPSVHFEEHAKKTNLYMGSVFPRKLKSDNPL